MSGIRRLRASTAARVRIAITLLAALLAVACGTVTARAADPWLFVNDVHYDPVSPVERPVPYGSDTSPALLTSTLDELRRVSPHPPVIVMDGDFLSHHFKPSTGLPTIVRLTHRLNALFPHTQFLLALGNEDSDCGDYAVGANSAFLRGVARAWEPLVNRDGAAPDFMRTFARDGFYTARLGRTGVRAVVLDNAFWSPFYHNACGSAGDPTAASLRELDRALRPAGSERRWVIMHIPPGIDTGSTLNRTHHLAIVPFLRPEPREAALALLADPRRHVELVVTGHVHRFAFRLIDPSRADPVPVLVSPAISPIFYNNPSFLTADVAPDGRIRNLEEHADDDGRWRDVGGLGSLGVSSFTGPALLDLHRRLEREPALRAIYSRLFTGGTHWHDISENNWRPYWCETTEFSATSFRDCLDEGGFSVLTPRGVLVVAAAIVAVLIVVIPVAVVVVRRVRRRGSTPRAG